jgi:hypothetical protein
VEYERGYSCRVGYFRRKPRRHGIDRRWLRIEQAQDSEPRLCLADRLKYEVLAERGSNRDQFFAAIGGKDSNPWRFRPPTRSTTGKTHRLAPMRRHRCHDQPGFRRSLTAARHSAAHSLPSETLLGSQNAVEMLLPFRFLINLKKTVRHLPPSALSVTSLWSRDVPFRRMCLSGIHPLQVVVPRVPIRNDSPAIRCIDFVQHLAL